MQSGIFEINDALRRGGVMNPALFNMMDEIIRVIRGKVNKMHNNNETEPQETLSVWKQ